MGTTQCSVSSPSRTRFHRRKSSETWLAIQRDPGRRWPPGPPWSTLWSTSRSWTGRGWPWSAAISCCPSRAGSPWATSKGLMPLAPGQGQGDVVGIPIGGGQAGQGGDFQEGRIPQVGPVARRSGPPLWSSTSHFKGKWDTGPWTARFWTAGAGASARRDRRECPDPTWWKWDIPDPGGPSAVGGRPPTRRPPERNPVNCSAESCADPATRQASPQASPLEVLDGEQTVRESRSACGWPNPESTERRLWGQSLKKPEGAPSRASQLPQRAIGALCGD